MAVRFRDPFRPDQATDRLDADRESPNGDLVIVHGLRGLTLITISPVIAIGAGFIWWSFHPPSDPSVSPEIIRHSSLAVVGLGTFILVPALWFMAAIFSYRVRVTADAVEARSVWGGHEAPGVPGYPQDSLRAVLRAAGVSRPSEHRLSQYCHLGFGSETVRACAVVLRRVRPPGQAVACGASGSRVAAETPMSAA